MPIDTSDLGVAGHGAVPPPPYPGSGPHSDYDLTPIPHAQNRPRLPEDKRNPHLPDLPDEARIVKFQTIVRENKEIVVGRIKVPTPGTNSHAFILRRYDTNAISLTTMYKVAFPGASEEDEKREMEWIKSSYDIRNTNGGRGSENVRLAGQWISRELAIHLAPAYGITPLVAALSRAVPDPNVAYRKSQRSQAASEQLSARHEGPTSTPKRVRRQDEEGQTDDRRHLTLEATTTVTAPTNAGINMEAEIESAKQLVLNLKRELRLRTAAGEELEDQGYEVQEQPRGTKRGKIDEDVAISGGSGSVDRVIKRSKRVEQSAAAGAVHKVAWGAAIFGLGVGAATLLPHLSGLF